jgi:hypothetical protein
VNVTATDLAGNQAVDAFNVTLSDSPFIVRGPGAAYAFSGTPDAVTLTITAGQVTFVADADDFKPDLNVDVVGAGTSLLMNTTQHLAALDVGAGASAALAAGGTRVLVVTDATAAGKLDLADNAMVIDYTVTSPLSAIRALLASGYASGAWNGNGINSSAAATTPNRALGYAESSAIFSSFPAMFAGEQVDNTAVLIRYTRYGDADISGNVNLNDFNRLAANFGGSNTVWSQGNFNYDNLTNLNDFNLLAANFGQSASADGRGGALPARLVESLFGRDREDDLN